MTDLDLCWLANLSAVESAATPGGPGLPTDITCGGGYRADPEREDNLRLAYGGGGSGRPGPGRSCRPGEFVAGPPSGPRRRCLRAPATGPPAGEPLHQPGGATGGPRPGRHGGPDQRG